ncbi:hypothetical protein NE237_027134 [Protea cynaroides]|uniref:Uncharacterized protein n=1 Tax=Protea cynaroides TaxID=273540 RepID=A0A9Q0GLZ7_9MAGN|nr:hypothetical protein NE237_027134 [Protea cynaroides]
MDSTVLVSDNVLEEKFSVGAESLIQRILDSNPETKYLKKYLEKNLLGRVGIQGSIQIPGEEFVETPSSAEENPAKKKTYEKTWTSNSPSSAEEIPGEEIPGEKTDPSLRRNTS